MTEEQIETILNKLAKEAKYEAFSNSFFDVISNIKIEQNFFGDSYWICGCYSIGVAKICHRSKDDYSYTIKLFLWGNQTEQSKQDIVEVNYLEELEGFIDLMLRKMLKSCEKVSVFDE